MRVDNWERKLYEYIESSRSLEFKWGENDCCLWAGKWVDICLGSDFSSQWIGQYSSESEALLYMQSKGFSDYGEIITSYLLRTTPKLVTRGDLVGWANGAIGICEGRKSWFLMPERGLTSVRTADCTRGWKCLL